MSPTHRLADLAYCAIFAALIIVLAFISIPVGAAGVPIVLQNAAVALTGLVLGARRGFFSVGLFLLVGLVLPVLAGGRTVISALGGPTAGYIVGYLLSAAVAGAIAYRARPGARSGQLVFFTLGAAGALVTQYLAGAIGLMIISGLTVSAAAVAQIPFLIPDAIKFAAMVAIALGVHAAFPDLLRAGRAQPPAAAMTGQPRTTGDAEH
ncbi:biotin transporter BioY [Corynebacterium atypicum]|uniref:biotin transporter BioY n=1 Tax=Corynebacterium atypicum TaxID=191610 RepID=UPI00068BC150|nr:biotin transporter BioY [Corynebacterium atypicum]